MSDKCGAIGALIVGGRVVGQVKCDLEAGHELETPVWHASVSVEMRHLGASYPAPVRFIPGTPHAMTMTWNPEESVDMDLFDPAEHFDVDVPIPSELCGVGGCVFLAGHVTLLHSWELYA